MKLLLLIASWTLAISSPVHAAPAKPNFLLILADDLGFSDLGSYGGEIETPHLDALAMGGLRLQQFYTSARCSPTRASILTGLHPHAAGFPSLRGKLIPQSVTIPEVLKSAGYRTMMVGKWHLGSPPPTARGFDEFYGMIGGYNSFWEEDPFYTRLPESAKKRTYPKDKFYATDVFADYSIDFIGNGDGRQPWFQYLAFNAPHFPLHAPESDISEYEAMFFEKGWDKIREERLARQKKLGIVGNDVTLTPRANIPSNLFNRQTGWADKNNPAWESIPEDRRRDLARRMAVYAAMVDRMDVAIGRVVAHLKSTGQFDNTVIFFLSDNGACAEWDPWGFDTKSGPSNILHTGEDLKKVGGSESYISYGSGWANACNTPYRLYKHYNHEGGIRSPMIIHWPAGLQAKGIVQGPGHITDFMPTICELAGVTYPSEKNGETVLSHEGVSLVPAMRGQALPSRKIFIEHEGNRSVRDGDWKLVALRGKPWELYQMSDDPIEIRDMADVDPARVESLSAAWEDWYRRVNAASKPAGAGKE